MAQWKKLATLAVNNSEVNKRLVNIYQEKKFPIDIRGQLAESIESVDWISISLTDQNTAMQAAQVHFPSLLAAIDHRIASLAHDFGNRVSLQQARENLYEQFCGNLMEFIIVMQKCMKDEKLLIESCDPQTEDRHVSSERAQENPILMAKINDLGNCISQAENELTYFGEHQAKFRIEYTTYSEKINQLSTRILNIPNQQEKNKLQKEVEKYKTKQTEGINNNYIKRVNVGRRHQMLAESLCSLMKDVWKDIESWKNEYKLSNTGLVKPKDGQIDILDNVCLRVNGFLLQLLNQVDKALNLFNDLKYESPDCPDEWIPKMQHTTQQLQKLLADHLTKIFLVDRCPRILKVITAKSLGFTMTCRLLGAHAFNLQSPPPVTAELHKEQDVAVALKTYNYKGMCEIVNGKDRPMDFHRNSKQYVGNFNSVQLTKVKQLDKSTDKLVMENRFGMVFYTCVTIREKQYYLTALAPPMALISHVLQDCMARAFLIWDSAFSKPDNERVPFEHPQEVSWSKVSKILNALFLENTGRGLNPEQLNYLGKVAFRDKSQHVGDYSKRKISKSMLIKERLVKDFSFWKWFYANMNLIKDRLEKEWKAGLIQGFISKEEILEKLSKCEPGTFMLRFSERSIENSARADICGCLTLAVVEIDPTTENKKIYHVKEHLTPKDIYERGLGATLEAFEVKDYIQNQKRSLLKYLYPDQDFKEVFKPFILHPKKDKDDGYNSGKLRIEIFLTEDNDPFPRTDKKITLPMSPISSVGGASPALSDTSSFPVTSPSCYSDLDDSQNPFSPGKMMLNHHPLHIGAKAIAMVQPQQAGGEHQQTQPSPVYGPTIANTDFQRMTLSPTSSQSQMAFQSPEMSDFGNNAISGALVTGLNVEEQQQLVNTLPPGYEHVDFMMMAAGTAADTLLNIDSGDLASAPNSGSGGGVVMDTDGDYELSADVLRNNMSGI